MAAKPWRIIPLVLPVGDTEYTIQPVEYAAGLDLIHVLDGTNKTIRADSQNEKLFRLVMGPVWDLMLEDHQPFPVMFRAGMAAVTYQVALVTDAPSADAVAAGEAMWESGVDPEAVAAAMAAPQKRPASKRSPSTASGNATRSAARSRTTTSPRTTRPVKAPAKAVASPGPN